MREKVRSQNGGSNIRECCPYVAMDDSFAAVSWSAPGGDFGDASARGNSEITEPESIRNLIPALRSYTWRRNSRSFERWGVSDAEGLHSAACTEGSPTHFPAGSAAATPGSYMGVGKRARWLRNGCDKNTYLLHDSETANVLAMNGWCWRAGCD